MLDAKAARLTKFGKVTIYDSGHVRVDVEGFEGENGSCREVAVLAAVWAIGELQRELLASLQSPGSGRISIS